MLRSRTLRRRLLWTGVVCVLLVLAALGMSLRAAEAVASAARRLT